MTEHLGPNSQGQVAQGVSCFVGLHGSDQAGCVRRIRFAQQLLEIFGLHLFEGVSRLVGIERGKQLTALIATQVLEKVGQLGWTQALQSFVRRLETHLGRGPGLAGRLSEGLDGRPVDHAVRRGTWAPTTRPETPKERGIRHVGADQADATDGLGQVQIGRPNDLDALHIDELVIQHVFGQEHFVRSAHHVAQIEPARAQQHFRVANPVDRGGRHEGFAAPDLDDQPTHRWVDLPIRPSGHDIFEAADFLAALVAHRPTQKAGQRHDGIEHAF